LSVHEGNSPYQAISSAIFHDCGASCSPSVFAEFLVYIFIVSLTNCFTGFSHCVVWCQLWACYVCKYCTCYEFL